MYNTERMINRLPEHFHAYKKESLIYKLINIFGDVLSTAEDDIYSLMKNRWFPVADMNDLEGLGALFGIKPIAGEGEIQYRTRLYYSVQELLFGSAGTVESIKKLISATIGVTPEILENPEVIAKSEEHLLRFGETWTEYCNSIRDVRLRIFIRALQNIRNPTIANLTTGEGVTFTGLLRKNAHLVIHLDGSASLAGIDVTDKIHVVSNEATSARTEPAEKSAEVAPRICKGPSEWKYTDASGVFDTGQFDKAVLCGKKPHAVAIQLEWIEHQPASFIVRIPLSFNKNGTDRSDLDKTSAFQDHLRQEVRRVVDSVKPAAVSAKVNFYENFSEQHDMIDEFEIEKKKATAK